MEKNSMEKQEEFYAELSQRTQVVDVRNLNMLSELMNFSLDNSPDLHEYNNALKVTNLRKHYITLVTGFLSSANY